jgi:hypothetical protein
MRPWAGPEALIDLARYPLDVPESPACRALLRSRRARLFAVLSYDPEPGRMLTEHTRQIFYGRVA